MPRILFDTKMQIGAGIDSPPEVKARMTGVLSDRQLLKNRSASYVKLFSFIDQKSLVDVAGWQELMTAVQDEFGVASVENLLGIVAKCFLGEPYEVHTLDLSGMQIIQHYKEGVSLPPNFEKARNLALHEAYCFVEVYTDRLVLVEPNGSVTTTGGSEVM